MIWTWTYQDERPKAPSPTTPAPSQITANIALFTQQLSYKSMYFLFSILGKGAFNLSDQLSNFSID